MTRRQPMSGDGKWQGKRNAGLALDETIGQPQVVTPKATTTVGEISVLFRGDFCLHCCKPEALKTPGFFVPAENLPLQQ